MRRRSSCWSSTDWAGCLRKRAARPELETARTPNLDALAAEAECGLHLPVGFGITPGSAPGHLALFGYQPADYPVGRGVVAAMGIAFPMQAGDVAARLNFATRDERGRITDRRAGRIPTETCSRLCELLGAVRIPGVEVFVRPVKDYRAVAVFRGEGLSDGVEDTDPQATGVRGLRTQANLGEGRQNCGRWQRNSSGRRSSFLKTRLLPMPSSCAALPNCLTFPP